MRAMWLVSDSESPTVATMGAPFPAVTSAIAPCAPVRSRATSRVRIIGSGSSSRSSAASAGVRWIAVSASLRVWANSASRSS